MPLVVQEDVRLTITKSDKRRLTAEVVYEEPIPAAIVKGTPLARLVLTAPDMGEKVIPLMAGDDVDKVSAFGKIGSAFEYLLLGKSGEE